MQRLEKSTLSREMQRPSSDQLWQTPALAQSPSPPLRPALPTPLDEQETA